MRTFLVSDLAAVDKRTNTLSIFNIIGELNAESFPVIVPRLTVVMVFERKENEEEKQGVVLRIKQLGHKLFEAQITLDFQGKLVARSIVEIRALMVERSEPLVFQLLRNGRQIATYPVLLLAKAGIAEPKRETGSA